MNIKQFLNSILTFLGICPKKSDLEGIDLAPGATADYQFMIDPSMLGKEVTLIIKANGKSYKKKVFIDSSGRTDLEFRDGERGELIINEVQKNKDIEERTAEIMGRNRTAEAK